MSSFDIPPILRICKKDNDNSSSYMKKKILYFGITFGKDTFGKDTFGKDNFDF